MPPARLWINAGGPPLLARLLLDDVHRVHLLPLGRHDHRHALLHHRLLVHDLGRVARAANVAHGAAAAAGAAVEVRLATACGARARAHDRPAYAAAALGLALEAAHHYVWTALRALASHVSNCDGSCELPGANGGAAARRLARSADARRRSCSRPCHGNSGAQVWTTHKHKPVTRDAEVCEQQNKGGANRFPTRRLSLLSTRPD